MRSKVYILFHLNTGNIPKSLGQLTNLTELHLYANELSGNIPITLGNLVHLKELCLYWNSLTGNFDGTSVVVIISCINVRTNSPRTWTITQINPITIICK